ncbi:Purine NTPase [Streptococcus pneumoniae]|uniref:AAA family ATPase n=1 Tax=Streptococcus pneumoniae TaxID=1313 RepID=UPI0007696145|nr:AAA family ATPase [Streptococcus pneumoniae]KXV86268.1 recombinase RecF [Streptococcus pneumoniae]MDS2246073.1 AAA family ATPase [Streptococcus pneumoniae]MDS2680858.1 AAA family ATPase [Streptococcus pneumoniae]MDS2757418.1 AAA family ATPase [Streptococcus pneumoniae]MDS2815841.1 AAA family ATPase [Streptococcus pneumoniae]
MKIKKILLYNFKNFRHETVIDFSDNMTFLVGPNGFGKTTIFDAIELGLTGDISRINQNNPVTGENIKYNKPFFQNDISEPVIIKLWLEKSNVNQLVLVRKLINDRPDGGILYAPKRSIGQFKLFRQEEATDENFSSLDNDIKLSEIDQTTIDNFLEIDGEYKLAKIFNLFNYIQQEETTFFLKKSEKDRSNDLSFLVKTDEIEDRISKIEKVNKAINDNLKSLTEQQEKLTQQELDNIPYQRLFNQQVFQFDKESPFSVDNLSQSDDFKVTIQKIIEFKQSFSISEYQRKLERDNRKKEINTIDSALRFAILFSLIQRPNYQWQWEKYTIENPRFFEYVLLENYLQTFETITHEYRRKQQLNQYWEDLSTDINQMTAQTFQYVQNDRLSNDFESLKVQLTSYQTLRESVGQADKNLSDLRQLRRKLGEKFDELRQHNHVDEDRCPFCNNQFDSFVDLKSSYDNYTDYLTEISSRDSQRLQEVQLSLNSRIQQVKQKITDEINSLTTNIDKKLLDRLQELSGSYQSYSKYLEDFKTFIQSYTNMAPYQLENLEFDNYNHQYKSSLQEFRSKLVVDDDVYRVLDINSLENIKGQLGDLREEFPELQFETYQLESSSYSKINMAMINSRLHELKQAIHLAIDEKYAINENLIADAENIFPTYFQSKVEVLEDIRIGDLEEKKLYIDKQYKLVQNQQFQDLSRRIKILEKTAERLKEIHTIYKEEVKKFKIGIVKQLRIPFFIYSAKMLQNYQQGMGIFLTYKKTTSSDNETVAIIRFKSDTKNDHDVMNQLSTGQLAVVSLAFTLSLNTMFKLSDNLNFLMIDDPIQDMDAMNVLSFIEILRHGIIDRYQIILSTYSDHNALFMGYKFANSYPKVDIDYKNVRELKGSL